MIWGGSRTVRDAGSLVTLTVPSQEVEPLAAEREGGRGEPPVDADAVGPNEREAPDRRRPRGADGAVEPEAREDGDAVGREHLAARPGPREGRLVDEGDAGAGAREDERGGAPREARADDDGVEPLRAHGLFQRSPWTKGPAGLTSVPGRARAAMARSSAIVNAWRMEARPSCLVIGLR